MSDLRSDMSGISRICLPWGPDMSRKTESHAAESRLGAKTMSLGLDKLTTCKLNTIELREIRRTTRHNLIARNPTKG
jgi:phage tail tube protein FII